MAPDIRVITFNGAAGNPRIATPEAELLELPFYREAFAGGDGAPLLALQEVGTVQAAALRRAAGTAVVLEKRRPGQGNALVIPDRYEVRAHAAGYYVGPQLRGIAHALRNRRHDWRQYGELRMWVEALLRDRAAGRNLTLITTHVSFDRDLNPRQVEAVAGRAARAGAPVILAGDFNAAAPAGLGIMASGPGGIDHVVAAGLEPVSAHAWTDVLERRISDHAPVEAVLRYP
jgi:endonuclease/exonuclease/phosphatase family metal-dependent hydrolase